MDISLAWLNTYLSKPATADEVDDLLTQAGLPIEERTDLPNGDTLLDVEVTSNRPDCLSHLGCAREVAALSDRELVYPEVPPEIEDPKAGLVGDHLTLENREPDACPLFTAQVIRNCKVGPSPAWLVERLEAIGQRSISNVVDITNFITHELGNPCHVFDLAKLSGQKLVIRYAQDNEPLTTLDDKERKLSPADLVVADAGRATSLAGVIGGLDSEVSASTTDVVFEMATWDPVTVRTQARRLSINTDAAYRFQRGVDPRTIDLAARRAVALICELTGGQLCEGVLAEGGAMPEARVVSLRPSRAAKILGIPVPAGDAIGHLRALEIGVEQAGEDELRCTIPPHRDRDLTREIDLIEELARVVGLDRVPTLDKLTCAVRPPQPERRAIMEIGRVLTGLGFDETVTFSFTSPKAAERFMPEGFQAVAVDDDRRKEEPTLRPSVLTGLLACRRQNQDARSAPPGAIRLYEISSVFAQDDKHNSVENQNLTLLIDAPGDESSTKRKHDDLQLGLRVMRGTIDTLARAVYGPEAEVVVETFSGKPPAPCWDTTASAGVSVKADGQTHRLGVFGLIDQQTQKAFDLDTPVIAAELNLHQLCDAFPPASLAHALPSFPHIERDLSLVVDEGVAWSSVASMVGGLGLDRLEDCGFVGTYRGKQVGTGKKSVTMRLRFRDADRTLRHEEVDPQIDAVVAAAKKDLGAEIRA